MNAYRQSQVSSRADRRPGRRGERWLPRHRHGKEPPLRRKPPPRRYTPPRRAVTWTNYFLVTYQLSRSYSLTKRDLAQSKKRVRGTLSDSPAEIGVPSSSIRDVDTHAKALADKRLLLVAAHAEQHLKFE